MLFEQKARQVLAAALADKAIVAVHVNPSDPTLFWAGFVCQPVGEALTLLDVDSEGRFAGYSTVRLEDIEQIHGKSAYLRGLESLYKSAVSSSQDDPEECAFAGSFPNVLIHAAERGLVVSIKSRDGESLTGYIREVGEDFVEIEVIVEGGLGDGYYVRRLIDMMVLVVDGPSQRSRDYLYKKRLGL